MVTRDLTTCANKFQELGVDQYGNIIGDGPLYKQYNMICGFIAQFCYVGAQVTIGT